jgi:predicted DNA-binding transcriptional regulator YafY
MRTIRLLLLFCSQREWQVDELKSLLQVSRRTIFRDLNLLRSAGLPLIAFSRVPRIYSLKLRPFTFSNLLTDDELNSLLIAAHHAEPHMSTEQRDNLQRSLRKLALSASSSLEAGVK